MLYCGNCRQTFRDTDKYCAKCGLPLQAVPAPVPVVAQPSLVVVHCPECGTEIASGKKFCRVCGYRLAETSASAPVTPQLPFEPEKPVAENAPIPMPRRSLGPTTSKSALGTDGAVATVAIIDEQLEQPAAAETAIESRAKVPEEKVTAKAISVETAAPETSAESAATEAVMPTLELAAEPVHTMKIAVIAATAAVLVVAVAALIGWNFFWSAKAKMFRAVNRGELVLPKGSSGYDYYKQIKGTGISSSTQARLRNEVLPVLISRGDSTLQVRMEGTSMKRSEFQQLADLYEWAASIAPDDRKAQARFHYTQGIMALLDGRLRDSLQYMQRSLDYDSGWAPAYNDMGKVYVRVDDYYHAEQSYRKATELQPSWVFPQLNLAGVYLHRKEWVSAEQEYLKAADIDKTLATTWYFLGQTYESQARYSEAISAYEHAVELAASRPSSAFRVDGLQDRIMKLKRRAGITQ